MHWVAPSEKNTDNSALEKPLWDAADATSPIAEQIHTLHRPIPNLRRTRDLLLPRLLSG